MRSLSIVAAIAARQHGLIERSQAVTAGVSAQSLERLCPLHVERVHPGVYRVLGAPPSREQRLLAACLAAGPDAAVSHRSAAPDLKIAIEVDGFATHGTPDAMAADFVRQNALHALGWVVIRFTWHQVVRQPKSVADAISAVLGSRSVA